MDAKRFALAIALFLAPAAARAVQEHMGPLDLGGYHLVDAKYLPFVGDQPLRYPDDVVWGFYAAGASGPAQACAMASYRNLKAFLQSGNPLAQELLSLGGTALFYLWINDYTQASAGHEIREAKLAHWPSERDYASGAWNWTSSVMQDGGCLLPDPDQIEATLVNAAKTLGNH